MQSFLTACMSLVAAQYNSIVGTTYLVCGTNAFVGTFPDTPASVVGLLKLPASTDHSNPTRRHLFVLAVRGPGTQPSQVATRITTLYSLLDNKSNLVCGYPGRIEPTEELGAGGYDANKLLIHTAQFSFITTKRNL